MDWIWQSGISSWRFRRQLESQDPNGQGVSRSLLDSHLLIRRENGFATTLRLKPGQYRLKFIVDDSWRCSKDIPTATDDDGTFVNWLEVDTAKTEEETKAAWSMDADFPSRPQGTSPRSLSGLPIDEDDTEWTNEIPETVFMYQYIEELPHIFQSDQLYRAHIHGAWITPVPQPPVLPRILEKVIVNNESSSHYDQPRWDHVSPAGLDDNSILAVPNHVVLNHLTASAIKNGTLGVGTTTRYRKKVCLIYLGNADR
jgi:5'-AMP-activated protein kinase regulatory beta subunit